MQQDPAKPLIKPAEDEAPLARLALRFTTWAERWYPDTETIPVPKALRLIEEKRFRAIGVRLERGRPLAHPEAEDGAVDRYRTVGGA